MNTYTLSPSELTFLWNECKFCFYMKVKYKIAFKGPFPAIFGTMGDLTSKYYNFKQTSDLSPEIPGGVLKYREGWVKSAPIQFEGIEANCMIRGRFDAVASFEDGSYGVIDYKTSSATNEKAHFYSRQLSAYAYALENAAPGARQLSPVTKLGLFIISPIRFESINDEEMAFISKTTWLDVPRDEKTFLRFLNQVMGLLDAPIPPDPGGKCPRCNYRRLMAEWESREQN